MTVACIYNKNEGMRVVSFEDREKLLKQGDWFNHPSLKNIDGDHEDDGQIRRPKGKRKRKCKQSPTETGIGTCEQG